MYKLEQLETIIKYLKANNLTEFDIQSTTNILKEDGPWCSAPIHLTLHTKKGVVRLIRSGEVSVEYRGESGKL